MAESEETFTLPITMKEIDSCWNGYLSALNNLCAAGNKLALAIAKLDQGLLDKTAPQTSSYLTNSWNDLARATFSATNTVKVHIMSVLQEYLIAPPTGEQQPQQQAQPASAICEKTEQKRIRDHNRLLALENAQTMINIQHQFCAASYDAFSSLTCCFVCQSPVGFPHDPDCTMIKQKTFLDQRSQTPSPHTHCSSSYKSDYPRANSLTGALTLSPGHITDPTFGLEPRGTSPQQNFQEQIPLQAIFETRGPLPNPGHLLGMKTPFCRNTKSSQYCLFKCPLFPLSGQRRWSEAAAVEASDNYSSEAEQQMRRWSMGGWSWEARSDQKNTVAWHQTRIMPALKLSNNSPDLHWQSPISSQDGLTEAIQLLSCKPSTSHVTTNIHS